MDYMDKLQKLDEEFQNATPRRAGFSRLPGPDTYECVIEEYTFIPESTIPYAKGEIEVKIDCLVTEGEQKGASCDFSICLQQAAKGKFPSGLQTYKYLLQSLGIQPGGLDPQHLRRHKNELEGTKIKVFVNESGYGRYDGPLDIQSKEEEVSFG